MERHHPKLVGERSEAHILAALLDAGYRCWLPWGEHHRADLIIESDDGCLKRVQCKTGRLRGGAVVFHTSSFTYHHPSNQGTKPYAHDYRGQIDHFAVHCPDTGACYLVPVDEVSRRSGSLRVSPPRNGQVSRIRWASDFIVRRPE